MFRLVFSASASIKNTQRLLLKAQLNWK